MDTYIAGVLMGSIGGILGSLIVVGIMRFRRQDEDRLAHRGDIVPSVRKSLGYQEIRLCNDPSCSCHRIVARSRRTSDVS